MNKILSAIADFFDPSSHAVCSVCGMNYHKKDLAFSKNGYGMCKYCHEKLPFVPIGKCFEGRKNLSYSMSAFYYKEPIRDLIIDYKFNGIRALADVLSYYLNTSASVFFEDPRDFNMIIPVPLSEKRLKERGYNQSALLSNNLAIEYGIMHTEHALKRIKHTMRQSQMTGTSRYENVENAFKADPYYVKGRKILIIDDVYTTGNTLCACADELKNKGAEKIIGLTLARRSVHTGSKELNELVSL